MSLAQARSATPAANRRARGIAMLLVLLALALAGVLVLGFLASQSTTTGIGRNARHHARARAVAESALTMGMTRIKSDLNWRANNPHGVWVSNAALAGGTFTLRCEDGTYDPSAGTVSGDGDLADDPTDPAVLTSAGTYQGVTHTVRSAVGVTTVNLNAVALVVPNAATLSASDTARKTLLEGWGWKVALLSESATLEEFTNTADDADVLYVSSRVTSAAMGSMLAAVQVGVVNEVGGFTDDLGLSSVAASGINASQVSVVTTSHYITQTLSGGNVSVTANSQPLVYAGGSTAAGATVLARRVSNSEPMLAVLEDGATQQSGGAAPARRVFLPWGGSAFDPAALSASGKEVLKRSLVWAAAHDDTGAVRLNRVAVSSTISMKDQARIDSFHASAGAYGGTNVGSAAVVSTNSPYLSSISITGNARIKGSLYIGPGGLISGLLNLVTGLFVSGEVGTLEEPVPIPTAVAPNDGTPSAGEVVYSSGTTTLTGKLRYNRLTVNGSAILQISGKTSIRVDNDLLFDNNAQVQLLPGASLVIYGRRSIRFRGGSQVNVNTASPSKLVIYATSTREVRLDGSARVYGTIVAPKAELRITDSAHLYGALLGDRFAMDHDAMLSMDATNSSVLANNGGQERRPTFTWAEQP